MLQTIRIKGYRGLKDFEIEFPAGKPLVLIGENATGKSTILDGIALICAVASGRGGRFILDRGGWTATAWAATSAEIELSVRFSKESPIFKKEGAEVEYFVRLGSVRLVPTVLDEEVRVFRQAGRAPFVAMKGGAQSWAANVQTKAYRDCHPFGSPPRSSRISDGIVAYYPIFRGKWRSGGEARKRASW